VADVQRGAAHDATWGVACLSWFVGVLGGGVDMWRDMSMWLVSAGVIGVIGVQGVLTALLIGVLAWLIGVLALLTLLLLLWHLGGRPPRLPPLEDGVRGRFIPE